MAESKKGRALGVGGVFFRSPDPKRLGDWYARYLGIEIESWGDAHGAGFSPANLPPNAFTVWSIFPQDTPYFGDVSQACMINLVVDDLDAALKNVALGGATVLPEREDYDYGQFGWIIDPDGNRVELWQPPEDPEAVSE